MRGRKKGERRHKGGGEKVAENKATKKSVIFVNNQLDAQFFSCMFIYILYMLRAAMCPSSGELIVSIRHLVYVALYR